MSVTGIEALVHAVAASKRRARDAGHWERTRRVAQTPPPGDWQTWLVMAGRGFGKTRTGAEWIREQVMEHGRRRVALVGPTAADVRDVMVEGESGLIAVCRRYGWMARYKSSLRRVDFPNGAKAFLYSADEPDRLRGPQHDVSWSDEIGAWRYGIDAWDMLQFGLRLGDHPRQIATSTPKPVSLVRRLMREATEPGSTTIVTRGSTYENRDNLAASFLTAIEARYANTRIGRQEIDGELLDDVEGALWSLAQLEACRVTALPPRTKLRRIVVAVDPPASSDGAECGIIAAGLGDDGRGYVLADRSHRGSPAQWASTVVQTFDTWQANEVIAETNQGGEMVTRTLRTERASLPIRTVHASRGKLTRAEPVSALYEQGRISHIGAFPVLEDQMATWVPGEESPDRMDALVWAFTDLLVGKPVPKSAAVAMPHTSTWS